REANFYRLINGTGDDIHPSLSPDQKHLAFASNRDGYWDLYLLDLTNNQVSQLTNSPAYDAAPSWSPDGKWLVYESYTTEENKLGNLEIYIRPVGLDQNTDQNILQLTSQSGADFSPVWSPSGRQIAFVSQRSANNEIWIADLNSVENRFINLSNHPRAMNQNPQWSSDGKALVWDSSIEGVPWIFLYDSANSNKPITPLAPGSHPVWNKTKQFLAYQFLTPNKAYLGIYSFPDLTTLIPLQALPSSLKGMCWLEDGNLESFIHQLEFAPSFDTSSLWKVKLQSPTNIPNGRQSVVPLEGVKAPYPFLQDWVDEAFQAWRAEVNLRSGWDYLSQLENAYLPLSSPPSAALDEEWSYTGRGVALESAALNSGWLITVREDFGADIYWRLYLKTRIQDGSLGQPLHELPFDLNARYSGNPIAYDQGGALLNAAPAGYYVDLTELALQYGWERIPALMSWKTSLDNARFNQFVARDGLTWYAAMMELYPPEALYTATPLPPPTNTPIPTPFTTHSPTQTLLSTPLVSPTPSSTNP
ncbi:MAG: hypothetical protein ACPL4H_10700, partial [Anaerolineales bacterium]